MQLPKVISAIDREALQIPRHLCGVCSAMMLFSVIGSQSQSLQCINSEMPLCIGQIPLHTSSFVRTEQGRGEPSASDRYPVVKGWGIRSFSHPSNVDFLVMATIYL